mgnify:CR=1 FL=1
MGKLTTAVIGLAFAAMLCNILVGSWILVAINAATIAILVSLP